MKEFLKKLIAAKEARKAALENQIRALQTENDSVETLERAKQINAELRSVNTELDSINAELNDARTQLAALDNNTQRDGFNPMGQFAMRTADPVTTDKLSSMEYRSAFMNYVQTGVKADVLNVRNAEHVSADLGILLPNTIVQEIIKGVEKVYGQLYSRVKHTNVKGGVQYPLGAFEASFTWAGDGLDTEHGVSNTQNTGSVDGYVTFSYHIGEIRIAQSLLQTVVTIEAFEAEITKALVEAFVKAMDVAILGGSGVNQPTGIFTDVTDGLKKIPAKNIITFTDEELADWTSWKKKLFANIPLKMRALKPEFVMTANTFEANIETLQDSNGQPVARELSNPVNGDVMCKFWAKDVVLVEESAKIKNFDEAVSGEYFGIYWVPGKAYAINTNMQFGYKKYFDENTNKYVNKGLVICDGKILDPKYIYLLKKA